MKKLLFFIMMSVCVNLFAQPWEYSFGTGTGSYTTSNTASTTFLPSPQTNGGTARIRVSNGGNGGFYLSNAGLSTLGSETELRIVAPSNTSVSKFSIYDYTAGKSFTLRFSILFGDASGSTAATSGTFYLFVGDGAMYSDNNTFTGSQVFTSIKWVFGNSGAITTTYRSTSTWTALGSTPFSQGSVYLVDIYGNNTTNTINYTYGTSQSVAANKVDVWVNGVLVGNDLSKAQLGDNVNIDSFLFYCENSTNNVANLFIDDIYYTNAISENPLPVELTSFSAKYLASGVVLNWQTATEINNNKFEVERQINEGNWEVVGEVLGHGNSNTVIDYTYTDSKTSTKGKYNYRLKQIDNDGTFKYTQVVNVTVGNLDNFELAQNYPNPFNPSTNINFTMPKAGNVKIILFNALGQEVATLFNGNKDAGFHTVQFNANGLPSGIYFYQMTSEGFNQVKKMILAK